MTRRRRRFTPEAAEQARRADAWWRENRPAAPALLASELHDAVERLETEPGIGQPHASKALAGVRRAGLRRTRFHIYYVVREPEILIVAVWSAVRGEGPPLPSANQIK